MINQLILKIDTIIKAQLHEVLNDREFQSLRNCWLGLLYLAKLPGNNKNICIKMLNSDWRSLCKDLISRGDLEHSSFFDKVYNQEFGHAGGQPFSLLIGNYEINIHNSTRQELHYLRLLGEVASVSFSPIILPLSAESFGYTDFTEHESTFNLSKLVSHSDYSVWRLLRQVSFSKFISLALPKVLLNTFAESVLKGSVYYDEPIWYWCFAHFFIAAVAIASFNDTEWFSDLNGVNTDSVNAGLIPNISAKAFSNYSSIKVYRAMTEFVIYEHQERQFSDLGFIPVCHLSNDNRAYFLNIQSIQEVDNPTDIANNLSYLLCVCRFAHYLKIIGRNTIGNYINPNDCQRELKKWLSAYVASNTDLPENLRHRFPLKKAEVQVLLREGHTDKYQCKIWLSPNLRTNQATTTILLTTEI